LGDDDDLCPAANSTTGGRLIDILTPHVSPSSGFSPCLRVLLSRQLLRTSHAWPTHSLLSLMMLPQLSATSHSPTRSQSQIYLLGGTFASASRVALHTLANKGTGPAFIPRLSMAPRFQFSGGVCSHPALFCARCLNPAACRQWYSAVW
jgi:hypothetical protein